jgi:hypothetical protein
MSNRNSNNKMTDNPYAYLRAAAAVNAFKPRSVTEPKRPAVTPDDSGVFLPPAKRKQAEKLSSQPVTATCLESSQPQLHEAQAQQQQQQQQTHPKMPAQVGQEQANEKQGSKRVTFLEAVGDNPDGDAVVDVVDVVVDAAAEATKLTKVLQKL